MVKVRKKCLKAPSSPNQTGKYPENSFIQDQIWKEKKCRASSSFKWLLGSNEWRDGKSMAKPILIQRNSLELEDEGRQGGSALPITHELTGLNLAQHL